MPEPTIRVLGTYALPFDDDMVKQQTRILYKGLRGAARQGALQRCREQLASTILIEVLVQDSDSRFRTAEFTQTRLGVPRDSWQAPWAERYLTVDGETLIETRWPEQPTDKSFRVAFFLHFWDRSRPLITSYGELECPAVEEMPERLRRLVPYPLLD